MVVRGQPGYRRRSAGRRALAHACAAGNSCGSGPRVWSMGTSEDAQRVFADIYRADLWNGGSGVGSAPDATGPYRRLVRQMLASPEITSVVDVGCGDWQLGSLVDWSGVHYIGIDIVPEVVEENVRRFGARGVEFRVADALNGTLPVGDLLLVKDVLQHWPLADVHPFLRGPARDFPFALLTNDLASVYWDSPVNADIALGAWRTLDLEAPPFSVEARWHGDYPVHGRFTKRAVLLAQERWWCQGEPAPDSVRRIVESIPSSLSS
jgi:SAM-dependent methyltransferase